jgi:hypothetical protein
MVFGQCGTANLRTKKKMKKTTILLILTANLFSYCQTKTTDKIFPGSNLRIQLGENFKPSDNAPGFEEADGNTKIYGFQAKMELSFDNAIKEQEGSINRSGFIIKKTEKFNHQNLDAATIEYEIPDTNFDGLIFLFGKENFQNIISSVYPKERKKEMRSILLNVKIDETIQIPKTNLLGFNSVDKSGPLVKTDVSSIVVTYEQRNEIGELVSNLKLTKFPVGNFKSLEDKESVDALASKFFPNQTVETDSEYPLDKSGFSGHKRVLKTIKKNGNHQYNYLVFLRLNKFDIVVVGSTNILENTKYMDEITSSIKLE